MMGRCIFITGTDTDVGKTVIAGCLAAALIKKGKKIAVYKPVQCGGLRGGKIASPDLMLVRDLSGIDDENLYNDYSFKLAASPHLAAERENKKIDFKLIRNQLKSLQKKYDIVLVEGAGGLIVPLTREYTVLDLIKDLDVPVLVVARAGLGTINHTSLTLNILKSNKIKVIGILLNYYKGGIVEEDNIKIIHSLNKIKILGVVPFSKNIKNLAEKFENYVDLSKL